MNEKGELCWVPVPQFESPDPEVIYSPEVLEDMKRDPELAEAMRNFAAAARQAMDGVMRGQYKTFDEGIESITGCKPMPIGLEAEDDD